MCVCVSVGVKVAPKVGKFCLIIHSLVNILIELKDFCLIPYSHIGDG